MAEPAVDRAQLRLGLLELLTFLGASAHGTVTSSKLYGPLRLMEAAERLIRLMDELGLADDDLRALADSVIAESMVISTDAEGALAFADRATLLLASKLKQAAEAEVPR